MATDFPRRLAELSQLTDATINLTCTSLKHSDSWVVGKTNRVAVAGRARMKCPAADCQPTTCLISVLIASCHAVLGPYVQSNVPTYFAAPSFGCLARFRGPVKSVQSHRLCLRPHLQVLRTWSTGLLHHPARTHARMLKAVELRAHLVSGLSDTAGPHHTTQRQCHKLSEKCASMVKPPVLVKFPGL